MKTLSTVATLLCVGCATTAMTPTTTTRPETSTHDNDDRGRHAYLVAARTSASASVRAHSFESAAAIDGSPFHALALVRAADEWRNAGDVDRAASLDDRVAKSESALRFVARAAHGDDIGDAGALTVRAQLPAIVFVDGEAIGNAPLVSVPVPEGVHVVRLAREGFDDAVTKVDVRHGKGANVAVELHAKAIHGSGVSLEEAATVQTCGTACVGCAPIAIPMLVAAAVRL